VTPGAWVGRHGQGIALAVALLVAAGLGAYLSLPRGLYPELSFPRIAVVATLPDATAEIVLLNDLFVLSEHRGKGIGRALIEASREVVRARGADHLEWFTATDNHAAQRLYDSTGAERSDWVAYELKP